MIVGLNREQFECYSQEIPLDAIREALVNAVAHRAYDYEALSVKITTRLWLQAELDKALTPGAERLAAAEKAIRAILTDLDNNPPEDF